MSEPFIGEIRMFAGNFAPRGWAFCDGQLLSVSQNDALFSLFGTIYGGDGRTTFGLPDLRGRIPIHMGTGPGLAPRNLGAREGAETETVTVNQLPTHTHAFRASTTVSEETSPSGNVISQSSAADLFIEDTPNFGLAPNAITSVGGARSHTNIQPFLCIHFIVALAGIFPSRF